MNVTGIGIAQLATGLGIATVGGAYSGAALKYASDHDGNFGENSYASNLGWGVMAGPVLGVGSMIPIALGVDKLVMRNAQSLPKALGFGIALTAGALFGGAAGGYALGSSLERRFDPAPPTV